MTIEWEGLGGTRESQVRWTGKEEMDEYGEVGGESGGGSGRKERGRADFKWTDGDL